MAFRITNKEAPMSPISTDNHNSELPKNAAITGIATLRKTREKNVNLINNESAMLMRIVVDVCLLSLKR